MRLFIFMGALWVFEGISFVTSPNNDTQFFAIFDVCQKCSLFSFWDVGCCCQSQNGQWMWAFIFGHIIHLIHHHNYHMRILCDYNFRYHACCGKTRIQNDIARKNSCIKLNEINSNLFDDNSNVLSCKISNSLRFWINFSSLLIFVCFIYRRKTCQDINTLFCLRIFSKTSKTFPRILHERLIALQIDY